MTNERKGYELLLGNIAVLTVFYLLLDFSFRQWDINVAQAMFWGWSGASLLALPFFLGFKRSRKNVYHEWKLHKKLILGLAVISVLASGLLAWGISLAGSGPAVLLESLQPVFVCILGISFLAERFTRRELLSAIVMLAGIVFIGTMKSEVSPLAAIIITISSFFYALHSFLFKRYGKDTHVFSFAFIRACIVTLFFTILIFVTGKFKVLPLLAIGTLTLTYVLGILVSRYFFFKAHKYLEVSKLNIFLMLQPVGVLIGAFLLFGDSISEQKIVGVLLILGGGYFFVKNRPIIK